MEKIIYLISKSETISGDQFKRNLIREFSKKVNHLVESLQIDVVDSGVEKASLTRVGEAAENQIPKIPIADGMVAVWVRSVSLRNYIESILVKFTESFHGYLVTESEQLESKTLPVTPLDRTPGFDQIALLKKPSHQDYDDWLFKWQSLHTQVAIDTQSTCRYTQNVIVRALTKEAPDYVAIVEEGYPDKSAMFDPMIFYDAKGDKDRMLKNIQLMMESCSGFIDFEEFPTDLIAMSQYIVKK